MMVVQWNHLEFCIIRCCFLGADECIQIMGQNGRLGCLLGPLCRAVWLLCQLGVRRWQRVFGALDYCVSYPSLPKNPIDL